MGAFVSFIKAKTLQLCRLQCCVKRSFQNTVCISNTYQEEIVCQLNYRKKTLGCILPGVNLNNIHIAWFVSNYGAQNGPLNYTIESVSKSVPKFDLNFVSKYQKMTFI